MAKAASRPCLIVGNWKMYKTIEQALEFIDSIVPIAEKASCQVMLAVPFTAIKAAAEKTQGTKIIIGAQNMNDASEGAFTGEVAAAMLKDAGASFVIIGHSERRTLFHEDNAMVNRKVLRALESGLQPLLCVGETYDERQENKTEELLHTQLTECLKGCDKEATKALIVAYEPVWAIGSGLAATPEIASSAMQICRKVLGEIFSDKEAQKIPIIYGGSVNPKNAESYLNSEDIDGLLIGSASLDPESFAKIIALRQNVVSVSKT